MIHRRCLIDISAFEVGLDNSPLDTNIFGTRILNVFFLCYWKNRTNEPNLEFTRISKRIMPPKSKKGAAAAPAANSVTEARQAESELGCSEKDGTVLVYRHAMARPLLLSETDSS